MVQIIEELVNLKEGNTGANSCWHVDGYDKLKPSGLPIYGCIDGYSRKIVCLKTVHSNSKLFIIRAMFLEHLKQYEGCPSRIPNDCGSENVVLAAIQSYIRRNHRTRGAKVSYIWDIAWEPKN